MKNQQTTKGMQIVNIVEQVQIMCLNREIVFVTEYSCNEEIITRNILNQHFDWLCRHVNVSIHLFSQI